MVGTFILGFPYQEEGYNMFWGTRLICLDLKTAEPKCPLFQLEVTGCGWRWVKLPLENEINSGAPVLSTCRQRVIAFSVTLFMRAERQIQGVTVNLNVNHFSQLTTGIKFSPKAAP